MKAIFEKPKNKDLLFSKTNKQHYVVYFGRFIKLQDAISSFDKGQDIMTSYYTFDKLQFNKLDFIYDIPNMGNRFISEDIFSEGDIEISVHIDKLGIDTEISIYSDVFDYRHSYDISIFKSEKIQKLIPYLGKCTILNSNQIDSQEGKLEIKFTNNYITLYHQI